jgi:hypothetical protein
VLLNIYCPLTPSCVELFEERNHRRLGIGAEIPLRQLGFFVRLRKVLVASRESCKLLWESVHPLIWQLQNAIDQIQHKLKNEIFENKVDAGFK